jgi:hypothetical protein
VSTYIVKIDYTHEGEVKHHRVAADTPIEAALQAGAFAARESEGAIDSFYLLEVEQIVETKKKVWG